MIMRETRGMRIQTHPPKLTVSVNLPGRQDRLRQMILYVTSKCAEAERMGLTKLNKILWKADFDAFAARHLPVTGRPYQRLSLGPAPKEMSPLLRDMIRDGLIEIVETDFGEDVVEKRPVARARPNLSNFTKADLAYVDAAIAYYWDKTGVETSDDSHGIAWASRENGVPMYYELSYLSDDEILPDQRTVILEKLRARNAARGNKN
jgi:hypothetical protein